MIVYCLDRPSTDSGSSKLNAMLYDIGHPLYSSSVNQSCRDYPESHH